MASMVSEIKQLQTSMTIRYVIAITLIAVFSVAAYLSMNFVIKGMDNNAYLVNVSGKQRLLSQYIALDAYRVYSANQTQLYDSELESVKKRLERNLDEMAHANSMLSSGRLPDGSKVALSPSIRDIYFDELNLKYRVQQYLALVRLITVLNVDEQKEIIITDIELRSEGILNDLDKVVQLLQQQGEQRLQSIKDTKLVILILTLVVLLLEVLFIFRPMVKRIVKLSQVKAHVMESLERKVATRTLHLEKVNKKLNELAHHDALTGLRNRLNFEANIEEVIEASEKHHTEYAVLMFDIDWFKTINDQYGHDVGDSILKTTGQILSSSVREGDHVYRAGGEEFVILLNRLTYEQAVQKAESIRQSFAAHVFLANGVKIYKTLSGGLYHSSQLKIASVKELLKLTDTALYSAKHAGRNKIVVANAEMLSKSNFIKSTKVQAIFSDLKFSKVLAIDSDIVKLIGYRREDFVSGKVRFTDIILPEDRQILERVTLNSNKESPFTDTIRLRHAKGQEVSLSLEAFVTYHQKVLEVAINLEGYSE